ncbi:MAG: NAD(P)/FAD-dependent oxidoreductase [Polyangiaceae bacterium]
MDRLDCVVIGAGVVGLAVARRLALAGRRVVLLEAEAGIGEHTSSRSSGVIHAGVYYPTGMHKARLCVAGRRALYAYLAEREVPHRRVGKLMIAVEEREIATLERLTRLGEANGVDDLVPLSGDEVRGLEPEVVAVRGVLSPSTGIVDPWALMRALQGDLEAAGGTVVLATKVAGGAVTDEGIVLETDTGRLRCHTVVNAAGFHAPRVADSIAGPHRAFVPRGFFSPGQYYALRGSSAFRRLVYPMPSPSVAHIHLVLDLAGRVRFGPDTSWAEEPSYAFDEGRAAAFYRAVRRYYPALADGDLEPDGVGIRAKIAGVGQPLADFAIQGPEVHRALGLVHLFGIESPGLTACLAIADEVAERLS